MSAPDNITWRQNLGDAVRYWEKGRVIYNLVLFAIVVAWFSLTWPHFRPAMNIQSLFLLAVLGVLANVCYSAAYLVDIPMQSSSFKNSWHRKRWALWLTGMVLAVVFTNYWIADEIYPYVNP
jgi:hypothetical protein